MEKKNLEKVLLTHQETAPNFDMAIKENEFFIKGIVKKYLGFGLVFDELMLVAEEGFYQACLKFDVSRGVKLSTFAYPYIKNEILEALASYQSKGMMSRSDVNNTYKIKKIVKQYIQDNGKEPTPEEISQISGEEFTVDKIKSLMATARFSSLDDNITEDLVLGDVIADEPEETSDEALTNKIQEMLDFLKKEERQVMTYYYLQSITNLAEIARLMNTNANHIRTVYLRALNKLRSNIRSIRQDRILREKLNNLN